MMLLISDTFMDAKSFLLGYLLRNGHKSSPVKILIIACKIRITPSKNFSLIFVGLFQTGLEFQN